MLAIIGVIFLVIFLGWPAIFQSPADVVIAPSRTVSIHRAAPERIKDEPISVKAISAVAFDKKSGARLFDQNSDQQRSIASLTKLMTALVFLDHNPGWDKTIVIEKADLQGGGKANLFIGDRLSVKDLFTAALIASDNTGISALVRSTDLSEAEFVTEMNKKAGVLRLGNAQFVEPTGLDPENKATAVEVAKLAQKAFALAEIHNALAMSEFTFPVSKSVSRTVYATNQLLGENLPGDARIIAGKTGHLNEAGFCFAGEFKSQDSIIITVILGAPTEEKRFSETVKVLGWTMGAYLWDNTQ